MASHSTRGSQPTFRRRKLCIGDERTERRKTADKTRCCTLPADTRRTAASGSVGVIVVVNEILLLALRTHHKLYCRRANAKMQQASRQNFSTCFPACDAPTEASMAPIDCLLEPRCHESQKCMAPAIRQQSNGQAGVRKPAANQSVRLQPPLL